ncbi:MAG: hypothetical protein KGI70_01295 [Patescibacteria group bacterium]|nr:hypothetical protein [Patescibacteria group bacterium]
MSFSSIFSYPVVKVMLALILVALLGGAAWWLYLSAPKPGPVPTNFQECATLYPVKVGLPKTCKVPWGKTFVEYTGNASSVDGQVRVDLPPAPVLDSSPVTVSGAAQKDWYSGGEMTVELLAGTGATIAAAQAQETAAAAPAGMLAFKVTLTFAAQQPGTQGALVIIKAGGNQKLILPVVF